MKEEALGNQFNYSRIGNVKRALKSYFSLRSMAAKGNSMSHCIVMDLDRAMDSLEEDERCAVISVLIKGYTQQEYARYVGVDQSNISRMIDLSLIKMSRFLMKGEAISNSAARLILKDKKAVKKIQNEQMKNLRRLALDIVKSAEEEK